MSDKSSNRAEAQRYVAMNRKARFDYFITDTLEAGIMLEGTEVKALRSGQASIQEAFAAPREGALYLINAFIPEYNQAGAHLQHETKRARKLLLKKREISKLSAMVNREGMTIVPLGIYFNARGMAKVELGMAKGKHKADKRDTIKKRDWERDKSRIMRERG